MADVQMNDSGRTGGSSWAWAIVVLVLVALLAWYVIGMGNRRNASGGEVNIHVDAPAATQGGGGNGGNGSAGGGQSH
jgi:hypothetical protein